MKKYIASIIKEKLKHLVVDISEEEILYKIEIPSNKKFGDFAFPCFIISKKISVNPNSAALQLEELLINNEEFEKIEVVGGYINFTINKVNFAKKKLADILNPNFKKVINSQKKILIEFPSPNTNKPLHLGHLRNITIGESIARILESVGNEVVRVNLYNDRGIHICKSMLAYQKFGEDKEPDKKSDHFVGDYYVLFGKLAKEDDSYNQKAQEMLVQWENGNPEIISLWEKMNHWAFKGFEQTFAMLGIKYDKYYYESKIYKDGKNIVLDGLKSGIFSKRNDGAVIIDLTNEGLDKKVLLRPDGTTVYMTQDLYLAKLKDEDFNADNSIYIVGNEQDYHFNALFIILKKIGFQKQLMHLSYGMVELPEGRMKSREGTVVDADDFIEMVKQLAKAEIVKRYNNISEDELENKSLTITLAAIKYSLLKTGIFKNMIFNPKEALSFDGDTGSYLLYSYARAFSILGKINAELEKDGEVKEINEFEYELIKQLSNYQDVLKKSADELNPSIIAHYAYDLASAFNEFYHTCPVLKTEQAFVRISLVKAYVNIFKHILSLLGIDVLEKM
ncbi:MAG: arginine--tRNA ligase [Deltaproteobacteria bacterium]|jgi:arginyl-tRNA synthetase|nr:arginine--tRNA ligase [Deltaproteobacteria bacterium]